MCTALIIVYVCVAEGDVRFKRGFLSRIQFVSVNDSLVDVTSIFSLCPFLLAFSPVNRKSQLICKATSCPADDQSVGESSWGSIRWHRVTFVIEYDVQQSSTLNWQC